MKTFWAYVYYQDKQLDGVVQQLGQYQLLKSSADILREDALISLFIFGNVQSISEHNCKTDFTVYKQLYMISSATMPGMGRC